MSTAFSLAPLFRSSVGFDRFNDLFETALRNEPGSSYPPYNVEKHAEDQYRIVIAAAGFQEDDLELQVEKGVLTVSGGKRDTKAENVTYQMAQTSPWSGIIVNLLLFIVPFGCKATHTPSFTPLR